MSSNSKFKKIVNNGLVSLVALAAIGGISVYMTQNATANHATNPGHPASGGSCGFNNKPVPNYAWFDYCIGATWMYYDFDSSYTGISVNKDTYTATISGSSHMPGGTIGPCSWTEEVTNDEPEEDGTYGTHEEFRHTSGFFRLGLVSYNPAKYLTTKNILSSLQAHSSYGSIVGILSDDSLQQIKGASGVPYLQIPGSMSYDDAHTYYNNAVNSGTELSSSPATWGAGLGGFCYDTSWTPSDLPEPDLPPTPPPGTPPPTINENGGHFYSRSTVSIPGQNTDVDATTETSNDDGTVTVRLSTDSSTFKGNFRHVIYWQNDRGNGYYGAPATTWKITRTVTRIDKDSHTTNVETNNLLTSGNTYQVAQDKGSSSDNSGNLCSGSSCSVGDEYKVDNLAQGETAKVCYTIHYDPKYISYIHQTGSSMYSIAGFSGNGSSTACYEITRPEEPDTDPYSSKTAKHPLSGSDAYGSIMYAGEDATIGWDNINAKSYPTRRYVQYKEIVYLALDTVAWYDGITVGNNYSHYNGVKRNPDDPCTYYFKKLKYTTNGWPATTGCARIDISNLSASPNNTIKSGSVNSEVSWNTSDGYFAEKNRSVNISNHTANNIVPDYVGYKYCNAAGWKFEYWIGVDKDGTTAWKRQNKDYWVTADAACRTIAKKPSLTTWNGSLFTSEPRGVSTTLSYRFLDGSDLNGLNIANKNNVGMVAGKNYGLSRYLYGSWSEYLAVIGGTSNGLASGASIARNGPQSNRSLTLGGVPLTIANNGTVDDKGVVSELGKSEISANQSLYTRLDEYLRSRAFQKTSINNSALENAHGEITASAVSSYNEANGKKINGPTMIYEINGNLTIDADIIIKTNNDSIYTLPRVVLFVNGDVNIASNVTQIDAWLIVRKSESGSGGTIYTCSNYQDADGKTKDNNPGHKYNESSYGTGSDTYSINGGNTCTKQLAFNGPVITDNIVLRRSYGSDIFVRRNGAYAYNANGTLSTTRDTNYHTTGTSSITKAERYTPAEIFNYRVDDYLWAYAQAGRYNSSYTESYSRELAPRY